MFHPSMVDINMTHMYNKHRKHDRVHVKTPPVTEITVASASDYLKVRGPQGTREIKAMHISNDY